MRYAIAIALLGAGLVGWNASRFIDAQAKVRTKDLTFLPSPPIARALALGQVNMACKLRWIDSFSYFQLQLDRRNDTIAGSGESAYERLYDSLISLDPAFMPYYEHASMNLGAVLSKRSEVLTILFRGLEALPHETQLWRMIMAELYAFQKLEERNPALFETLLDRWAEAIPEEDRQMVWDWKAMTAKRRLRGLEQIPYWTEQYRLAPDRSAQQRYLLDTVREQIATFGLAELNALATARLERRFVPAATIADLLDPELVRERHPKGLPGLGPIAVGPGGTLTCKADPFGYAYVLRDGKAVSPGLERMKSDRQAGILSSQLESQAITAGTWPTTIAEAVAQGLVLPPLADPAAHWELTGQRIVLVWPEPSAPPYVPAPVTPASAPQPSGTQP